MASLKTALDPTVVSASANVNKVQLRAFLQGVIDNLLDLYEKSEVTVEGSSWILSSTVPSNTIGSPGWHALLPNGDVYEKGATTWTFTGTNLKGAPGTSADVATIEGLWLGGDTTLTLLTAVQLLANNKADLTALDDKADTDAIPAIINTYLENFNFENTVYSSDPSGTVSDGSIVWAQPPSWDPLSLGGTAAYAVKRSGSGWAAVLGGPPGTPGAPGASGTALRFGRASAPTGISLKFGRASGPVSPALVPRVGTIAEWDAYNWQPHEWGVVIDSEDEPTGQLVVGTSDGGVGGYKIVGSEIVTVKQFGAVGDGVYDDRPAVQLAFNTVGAAGGGRIVVPAGMRLNFASYQLEPNTSFSSQQFCILVNYDNLEFIMEPGSVIVSSLVPRISTAGPGYGLWSGVGCLFFINGCRKGSGTIDTGLVGRPGAPLYAFDPVEKNASSIKLTTPSDASHFAVGDWGFLRTGQLTNNGANTGDAEFNKITKIGADGRIFFEEPLKKSYQPENYPLSYTNDVDLRGDPAPFGITNATPYFLHNIKLDIIVDAPYFNAIQHWQARAVDTKVRGRCRSIVHGGSWMKETLVHDLQVSLLGSGSEIDPERPGDWALSTGTGSSECRFEKFDLASVGRNFIHIHEGSANITVFDGNLKAALNRDDDSAVSIRARAYNVLVQKVNVYASLPPDWTTAEVITAGDYRKNGGKIYRALSTGVAGDTAPTHTLYSVSDGTVSWRPMEIIPAWAAGQTVAGRTFRLFNGHILHCTRAGVTADPGPVIGDTPAAGDVVTEAGGVEWEILKNDSESSLAAWATGVVTSANSYRHNGGYLFQSTTSGTTGAVEPFDALDDLLDGTAGVFWIYAGTTNQTGVFVDESCEGGGAVINVTTQVEGGPGVSIRAQNWTQDKNKDIGPVNTVGVFVRERAENMLLRAQDFDLLVGTGVKAASSGTSTTAIVMPYWQFKDAEFGRVGASIFLPPEWRQVEVYLWVTNPGTSLGRVVTRAGLSEYRPGDLVGVTAGSVWTNLGSSVSAGHITTSNGKVYQTAAGGTKGATAPSHSNLGSDKGDMPIGVTWRYLGAKIDWAAGQVVVVGDLRTVSNRIYRALGAGTTGATAPTGTTAISDGSVTWGYISTFTTWGGGLAYFDAIASSGSYVVANSKLYAAYNTGLSGDLAPSHTDLGSDGTITDWRYVGVDLVTSAAIFTAQKQNVLQAVKVSTNLSLGDNRYPYLFTIERDGAHAQDTLAEDLRVHYVELRRAS